MKEIKTNENSKYKFICIEPEDVTGVNIGGILALPKEGVKTNKLLTMIQFDKCENSMKNTETGEEQTVVTVEDAAKRVINNENIDEALNGLGLERTSYIITTITKWKKIRANSARRRTKLYNGCIAKRMFY